MAVGDCETEHIAYKRQLPEVRFTRRSFLAIWSLVVFLHVWSAVISVRRVVRYAALINLDGENRMVLVMLGYSVSNSLNIATIVLWGAHAMTHFRSVFIILHTSWRAKQLVFQLDNPLPITSRVASDVQSNPRHYPTRFLEVMSVSGEYFEIGFNVRKLIEIASLILQAYRVSVKMAVTSSMGTVILVTVVGNCWSTPTIQCLFHHNRPLMRLLCILVDSMCTFLSIYAISFILVFETNTNVDIHDGFFMIGALQQVDTLYANTWPLLLVSAVTLYCLVASLKNVKELTRRESTHQPLRSVVSGAHNTSRKGTMIRQIAVTSPRGFAVAPTNAMVTGNQARRRRGKLCARITQTLTVLLGITILGVHIAVYYSTNEVNADVKAACLLETRPWFASQYSCSILDLNCHRLGHDGASGQLEQLLTQLNPNALLSLTFSHCPRFDMPQSITRFTQLRRLDIVNTTIHSWTSDAAVTHKHHPHITALTLVRVRNITTLPPGLTQVDFPQQLSQVYICDTDLAALNHHDLNYWPDEMLAVFIEQSHLVIVPAGIVEPRRSIRALSFAANELTSVPDSLLVDKRFDSVVLAGNTILSGLPQSLGTGSISKILDIAGTNVTSLPVELQQQQQRSEHGTTLVRAGGSPVCNGTPGHTSTWLDCQQRDGASLLVFPLDRYLDVHHIP